MITIIGYPVADIDRARYVREALATGFTSLLETLQVRGTWDTQEGTWTGYDPARWFLLWIGWAIRNVVQTNRAVA